MKIAQNQIPAFDFPLEVQTSRQAEEAAQAAAQAEAEAAEAAKEAAVPQGAERADLLIWSHSGVAFHTRTVAPASECAPQCPITRGHAVEAVAALNARGSPSHSHVVEEALHSVSVPSARSCTEATLNMFRRVASDCIPAAVQFVLVQ